MLFTWDTTNLCIVFRQWHIRSTFGLIVSLLAVVALGAGYEALRAASRRYEHALNKRTETTPRESPPTNPFPPPRGQTEVVSAAVAAVVVSGGTRTSPRTRRNESPSLR